MADATEFETDESSDSDETTILIVEDEQSVLETYELYVETEGYDVRTAANGGEALVELGSDVDVVLLDRRMPGMSGDEVLEHIKDWELECRVVMVTAVDPDENIIEMGFDDYLSKPVSKSKVIDTIDQLVLFDRYEELLTEYHSLTKAYATLKSNLEGQPDTEALKDIKTDREQVRKELEDTIHSFTDDVITDIFADIHDISE
jgi:two-component system response regulator AdeR